MSDNALSTKDEFKKMGVGFKVLNPKNKIVVLQVPDELLVSLAATERLKEILNRLRKAGFADAIVVGDSVKVSVKNKVKTKRRLLSANHSKA